MRTTTLRSSISSFGPFCSNGSEPRSKLWTIEIEKTTLLEQSRAYSSYYSSRAKPRI
jgi:hypothetical protein